LFAHDFPETSPRNEAISPFYKQFNFWKVKSMFKKTLDVRRTLAYGLEFRKFKRRLNVIKRFCFFIFVMLTAKSVVITQLEVITVTIPLAGSKISSKY
jgi:hypothetical protein